MYTKSTASMLHYVLCTTIFFSGKDIFPQLWIAPRGLITVLLFFSIPNGWVDINGDMLNEYTIKYDCTIAFFDQGILLYTILLTSIIMTISLIMTRGEKVKDVLFDSIKLKSGDNKMVSKIEEALSDDIENIGDDQKLI